MRFIQPILAFASVGVVSSALHLALFVILERAFGTAQAANLVALLVATLANAAVNRRWPFGIIGTGRALRHQLRGLVVFGVTWAVSAIALWLVAYLDARPSTIDQTATVAAAMAISAAVRFAAKRSWMLGSHPRATVQTQVCRPLS